MLVNHVQGERFPSRKYTPEEVEEFLRSVASTEDVFFCKRVLFRLKDCGLEPVEVVAAIQDGVVRSWELTPDRWDIRLEVRPDDGDVKAYNVVVYLTKEHSLYCEDIRDAA